VEMKEKAYAYIDEHKEEMLALWRDLVNTDSGSENLEGVRRMAARVRQELERDGVKVQEHSFEKAGPTLTGFCDNGGAGKPVLFMGHMDTVFNDPDETKRRPFTIEDGRAYGPGVLDMKGGIVIALFAFRALKAAGFAARPFKFAFVGDEEVGHQQSNATEIIGEAAKGCAAAFNFETGFMDNAVVTGRKGACIYEMKVHGVAAHSGNEFERGRSAILEAAHKTIAVQALTDLQRGITFNVGLINGGKSYNAVPGECVLKGDSRYLDPDVLPEIKKNLQTIADTNYVEGTHTELVTFRMVFEAMKRTADVGRLHALWTRVSEEEGFGASAEKLVGGGSDAPYAVQQGVPTICAVGVKGAHNHSPEEFAVVETLFERAKLAAAVVLRLEEI